MKTPAEWKALGQQRLAEKREREVAWAKMHTPAPEQPKPAVPLTTAPPADYTKPAYPIPEMPQRAALGPVGAAPATPPAGATRPAYPPVAAGGAGPADVPRETLLRPDPRREAPIQQAERQPAIVPGEPEPRPRITEPMAGLRPDLRRQSVAETAEKATVQARADAEAALAKIPTTDEVPPGMTAPVSPAMAERWKNPPSTGEVAASAAKAFVKDALMTTGNSAQTIAIMARRLDAEIGDAERAALPIEKGYISGKWAKIIRDTAEELFPEDEIFREKFVVQVMGGLGQSTSFMAGGAAGGGARAVMTMGALAGGAPAYEQAIGAGAGENKAMLSMLIAMGLGTTEAVPVAGWLNRFGAVKTTAGQAIKDLFTEAIEEGGQEFLQQFLQNAADKGIYDPTRNVWTGVEQGAAVGGASGALMSAFISAITGARMAVSSRRAGKAQAADAAAADQSVSDVLSASRQPVTPWAKVMESDPATKGLGVEIEEKAAAGQPLTGEEAAAVVAAHEAAKEQMKPPPPLPVEVAQGTNVEAGTPNSLPASSGVMRSDSVEAPGTKLPERFQPVAGDQTSALSPPLGSGSAATLATEPPPPISQSPSPGLITAPPSKVYGNPHGKAIVHATEDPDELLRLAQEGREPLRAFLAQYPDALISHVHPTARVKKMDRLMEKADFEDRPISSIGDALAGRIIVDSEGQAFAAMDWVNANAKVHRVKNYINEMDHDWGFRGLTSLIDPVAGVPIVSEVAVMTPEAAVVGDAHHGYYERWRAKHLEDLTLEEEQAMEADRQHVRAIWEVATEVNLRRVGVGREYEGPGEVLDALKEAGLHLSPDQLGAVSEVPQVQVGVQPAAPVAVEPQPAAPAALPPGLNFRQFVEAQGRPWGTGIRNTDPDYARLAAAFQTYKQAPAPAPEVAPPAPPAVEAEPGEGVPMPGPVQRQAGELTAYEMDGMPSIAYYNAEGEHIGGVSRGQDPGLGGRVEVKPEFRRRGYGRMILEDMIATGRTAAFAETDAGRGLLEASGWVEDKQQRGFFRAPTLTLGDQGWRIEGVGGVPVTQTTAATDLNEAAASLSVEQTGSGKATRFEVNAPAGWLFANKGDRNPRAARGFDTRPMAEGWVSVVQSNPAAHMIQDTESAIQDNASQPASAAGTAAPTPTPETATPPPPAPAGAQAAPAFEKGARVMFPDGTSGTVRWTRDSKRGLLVYAKPDNGNLRVTPAADLKPGDPAPAVAAAGAAAAGTKVSQAMKDLLANTLPASTSVPPPADSVGAVLASVKAAAAAPNAHPSVRLLGEFAGGFISGKWSIPRTPSAVEKWMKVSGVKGLKIDDAYDAIEAMLTLDVRLLRRGPDSPFNSQSLVDRLTTLAENEKRLGNRGASMEAKRQQQFSTPLAVSQSVVEAAGVRAGDLVMEPSAGTGNLIEPLAGRQDVRLWVNEIDARRAALLRALGYTETIQDTFFKTIPVAPNVVVMNPPWGGYSMGWKRAPLSLPFKANDIFQEHVAHALRSLAPGGRLVALVGKGYFAPSAAPFRKWIAENYNLRGTVTTPPGAYKARGTDFDSVLLIIDRSAPAAGEKALKAEPKDWAEYAAAINDLAVGAHARPAASVVISEAGVNPAPAQTSEVPDERPGGEVDRPDTRPGPRDAARPDRDRPGAGGLAGERLGDDGGGEDTPLVPEEGPADGQAVQPGGSVGGVQAAGVRGLSSADIAARRERDRAEVRSSLHFAEYRVRGRWAGRTHPRLVIETTSLAGVSQPKITYTPHPDIMAANKRGWLADENMDVIARAAQNNLEGKGYVIADGTGFGKARQVIAIALDWIKSGHANRVLIVTSKGQNVADLLDTFEHSGIALPQIINIADFKPNGKDAQEIPVLNNAIYIIDAEYNFLAQSKSGRLAALGFDGLIADEADKFRKFDSKRAVAWNELHQNMLGRAKPMFVYTSASVGTEVEDLAYMHGLRAWPMGNFANWMQVIKGERDRMEVDEDQQAAGHAALQDAADGGDVGAVIALQEQEDEGGRGNRRGRKGFGSKSAFESGLSTAATEQVIRELAQDGFYTSRSLWRGGAEFAVEVAPVAAEKIAAFDRRNLFMRDVSEAFDKYGARNKSMFGQSVRSNLQFAYKRAAFDLNLDAALATAKAGAASGHQVVFSLINVNATDDENEKGNIGGAIGRINTDDVTVDSEGNATDNGKIPEALRAKADLMERIKDEAPNLRDPIATIIKELGGKKNVGVITGAQSVEQRRNTLKQFQDGKIQFLVISAAGKRGISAHHVNWADHFGPARGRRLMVIADTEWMAPDAMQEMGRVDRASQLTAPRIVIVTPPFRAVGKFLGTIANRLAQFGVTSKGQEGSTETEALDDYRMGGALDMVAMRNAWKKAPYDLKDQFTNGKLFNAYGGERGGETTYNPKDTAPSGMEFRQFLADLQLMPVASADAFMDLFDQERTALIEAVDETKKLLGKTSRMQGAVLETADLAGDLKFYRVKTAGVKQDDGRVRGQQEFGIVTGKVATTGMGTRLARAMVAGKEGLADQEDAENQMDHAAVDAGVRGTELHYTTFLDTTTGKRIGGVFVPYQSIETLLGAFDIKAKKRQVTIETLEDDLAMGVKVEVHGHNGATWVLRRRQDGRIALDGAKMGRDGDALQPGKIDPETGKLDKQNLAEYNVAGSYWNVPTERLRYFVDHFPIVKLQEGKVEAEEAEGAGGVPEAPPLAPTMDGLKAQHDAYINAMYAAEKHADDARFAGNKVAEKKALAERQIARARAAQVREQMAAMKAADEAPAPQQPPAQAPAAAYSEGDDFILNVMALETAWQNAEQESRRLRSQYGTTQAQRDAADAAADALRVPYMEAQRALEARKNAARRPAPTPQPTAKDLTAARLRQLRTMRTGLAKDRFQATVTMQDTTDNALRERMVHRIRSLDSQIEGVKGEIAKLEAGLTTPATAPTPPAADGWTKDARFPDDYRTSSEKRKLMDDVRRAEHAVKQARINNDFAYENAVNEPARIAKAEAELNAAAAVLDAARRALVKAEAPGPRFQPGQKVRFTKQSMAVQMDAPPGVTIKSAVYTVKAVNGDEITVQDPRGVYTKTTRYAIEPVEAATAPAAAEPAWAEAAKRAYDIGHRDWAANRKEGEDPRHEPSYYDLLTWWGDVSQTGPTEAEMSSAVIEAMHRGVNPTDSDDLQDLEAYMNGLDAEADTRKNGLPKQAVGYVGKTGELLTPAGRVTFRYEVLPHSAVIPSHDPLNFGKMEGYPEGVQNRPYHSDKNEQNKVIRQASDFMPGFVLSTAPDAINGPPILAPNSNVVLGGNSRAMTIARSVGSPQFIEYMKGIREGAAQYGLDLSDPGLATLLDGDPGGQVPMLVRRVILNAKKMAAGPPTEVEMVDTMRQLARAFNMPLTQALNSEAEAVSRGKALSADTVGMVADWLNNTDAESIAEALKSLAFNANLIPALIRDGVFSAQDIGKYTIMGGNEWNVEGRQAVQSTILGSVIDDPDLLQTSPPALLNKVARALGALVSIKNTGPLDLNADMKQALILARKVSNTPGTLADYMAQAGLFGKAEESERVVTLAARLMADGPRKFGERLKMYARAARDLAAGQKRLLGDQDTAESIFHDAFEGPEIYEMTGRDVPPGQRAQAGAVTTAPLRESGLGRSAVAAGELVRAGMSHVLDQVRPARTEVHTTGVTAAMPIATGAYARWMRLLGPERGRAAYNKVRRHENAKALMLRYLREDTASWFEGLTTKQRMMLFEAAKGIRRDPSTGLMIFGALQPGGLLQVSKSKEGTRAVNAEMGVDMDVVEANIGGMLANGYIIGEYLDEYHAFQLWRPISPESGRMMYEATVAQVPRAAEILDDYTALEDEVSVNPMFGVRMPPRSREIAQKLYDIDARRNDEVAHVPTIWKEPRTFVGRTRNLLRRDRSEHRRIKTGRAAEGGLEIKDLMAATLAERSSLLREEMKNNLVADLLPLILTPKNGPAPKGWSDWNAGVLKDPKGVIRWISKNKAMLEGRGIDTKGVIEAVAMAGGKQYIIPTKLIPEVVGMMGEGVEDTSATYRQIAKAADHMASSLTNYVLTVYLTRPSTSVRNAATNAIWHGTRTMRDAYVGLLEQIPGVQFEELPMAQFVADIVAPFSAMTKEVRQALPPEVLGRTFAQDLGTMNMQSRMLRLTGFNAGDIITKRVIYESVIRAQSEHEWLRQGKPGAYKDFLTEYRRSVPPEVEELAWRTTDTLGPFDYGNVATPIAKMKHSTLLRGVIPYPTYYYKTVTSAYRTIAVDPFFGFQNYANLFGPGRAKNQRVLALANMLTGLTVGALIWGLIPNSWDDYPDKIKDEDLPPEYRTTGRLKVPFVKSKTGESYWLRVLDLPLIGDIIAAKAMTKGHYTFDDYVDDRLSVGPLALMLMYMKGWTNKYTAHVPKGTLFGRMVAGGMPFAPYLQSARRLVDPYQRKDYDPKATPMENFYRGFAGQIPGLSNPEAISRAAGVAPDSTVGRLAHKASMPILHARSEPHAILRYPTGGELTRLMLLNVKPVVESQRRTAIREALERRRAQEAKKTRPPWASK